MRDTLVFVGGFAGTATSPSGFREVYDPKAPNGIRRLPFRRDIFSSLTPSVLIWEPTSGDQPAQYHIVDFGAGFPRVAEFLRGILDHWHGGEPVTVHCYLTHEHNDHTEGFHRGDALLLRPQTRLVFHSPDLSPYRTQPLPDSQSATARMVNNYLGIGYWPAIRQLMEKVGLTCEHVPFQLGDSWTVGRATVRTVPLQHPEGCVGYRFELANGKVVATGWDYEPPEAPESAFVRHIDGATVALFDLQYRDAEADGDRPIGHERAPKPRRGWGHGTPRRLFPALAACQQPPGVMVFGHLDPNRPDEDIRLFYEEYLAELEQSYGIDPRSRVITAAHDGEVHLIERALQVHPPPAPQAAFLVGKLVPWYSLSDVETPPRGTPLGSGNNPAESP